MGMGNPVLVKDFKISVWSKDPKLFCLNCYRYASECECCDVEHRNMPEDICEQLRFFNEKLLEERNLDRKVLNLLHRLDQDALFQDNWHGNGCIHGYKPSCDCPNKGCQDADDHKLWNEIAEELMQATGGAE